MPQMAPMSWLFLFIIFTISFMLFNMMNYYLFIPSMIKSNKHNKMQLLNSLNWKW